MAFLQRHEFDDGAEVVAEMQIAGRLDPEKHQFLERHRFASLRLLRCMPCHGRSQARSRGGEGADSVSRLPRRARRRGRAKPARRQIRPRSGHQQGDSVTMRPSEEPVEGRRENCAAGHGEGAHRSRRARSAAAAAAPRVIENAKLAAPHRISDSALLQAPQRDGGRDAAGAEQPAEQERRDDRRRPSPSASHTSASGVLMREQRRRQRFDQHMAGQAKRQPHSACAVASRVGGVNSAVLEQDAARSAALSAINPSVAGSASPTASSSSARFGAASSTRGRCCAARAVNGGHHHGAHRDAEMPSGSSKSRLAKYSHDTAEGATKR